MQDDVTPPAAAARRIPDCIPEFLQDIPARCGGNLQAGGFAGEMWVNAGWKGKGVNSFQSEESQRGRAVGPGKGVLSVHSGYTGNEREGS